MIDQARIAWFAELNRGLTDKLEGKLFDARFDHSLAQLEQLAGEILHQAAQAQPQLEVATLTALIGTARTQAAGYEPMLLGLAA